MRVERQLNELGDALGDGRVALRIVVRCAANSAHHHARMATNPQGAHAEIARRYRRKRRPSSSISTLRIADLSRLIRARHGYVLPNDAAGNAAAEIMAHHLAVLPGDPRKRTGNWLQVWAPWMTIAAADALMTEAIMRPQRWRADKLAWKLKLIEIDRAALQITTIGAIDLSKAERIKRRKERNRLAKLAKRLAKGAKPRAQYLAASITKAKPWAAEGISRASWYRRMRQ